LKTGTSQDYAFDYDLSSNLRSVQVHAATSASIAYAIDGLNHRIGRSVTPTMGSSVSDGLLYDEQGRVVAELDGANNVLSTFVYGLKPNVPDYMVQGGVAYRIVSDWRGDVRLVLDTTKIGGAAVVEQIDYDEWGNVVNLVDPSCSVGGTELCWQPFGFAGGVFDVTTGIVRFGARDYDPAERRWTQKDPIRFGGGQENIYVYTGDDSVNGSDPSGLDGDTCGSPPVTFYCGPQTPGKVPCPCGPGAVKDCNDISGACPGGCSPCKASCWTGAKTTVQNCLDVLSQTAYNQQLCLAQGWYYNQQCYNDNCQ
jgi:RHS repeat-associated protein